MLKAHFRIGAVTQSKSLIFARSALANNSDSLLRNNLAVFRKA